MARLRAGDGTFDLDLCPREVAEGHDARLGALDALLASTADRDLERRIPDLYVEKSEAAFVLPPALPT